MVSVWLVSLDADEVGRAVVDGLDDVGAGRCAARQDVAGAGGAGRRR